jgi:hypothetical protein
MAARGEGPGQLLDVGRVDVVVEDDHLGTTAPASVENITSPKEDARDAECIQRMVVSPPGVPSVPARGRGVAASGMGERVVASPLLSMRRR